MSIYLPPPEARKAAIQWVSERTGGAHPDDSQPICVLRDGHLIAAALFHNYAWPSIHVSIAADSPRWATRGNIRAMLRYAFSQCRCKVLVATIAKHNKRSRKLAEGVGFEFRGTVPDGSPEGDVCIYALHESRMSKYG